MGSDTAGDIDAVKAFTRRNKRKLSAKGMMERPHCIFAVSLATMSSIVKLSTFC